MKCRVAEACTNDAAFGIVIEEEYTDGATVVSVLSLTPACLTHATEYVHEVRQSTTPDGFTVLHVMHAAGDPGRLS